MCLYVSSAFFRQYLRNLGWFLFLKVLRCFGSLCTHMLCGFPQWRFTCLWGFSSSDVSSWTTSRCVVEPKHPLKTVLMRGGIEPPTIEVWVRRSTKLNYLIFSSHTMYEELFFCHPKRNQHCLRRGLPGYLILFAPHAFAPQCQVQTRKLPSL